MNTTTIIITALALAMDAFAVSTAIGLADRNSALKNSIKCGLAFGFFQSLMTAIGWLVGKSFFKYIQPVDHWVAFVLLAFIGGKMIYESFHLEQPKPLSSFKMLILLAFATSIDALAAGLSFSSLNTAIILPVLIIGIISLVLSFIGVWIGKFVCNVKSIERYANILGGTVLIAIGIKILIQHIILGI